MKLLKLRRLVSLVTCFSLVLQSFLPFTLALPAYAVDEVATDSSTVVEAPTPEVTPEVTPEPIVSPEPTVEITPEPSITPEVTPEPTPVVNTITEEVQNNSPPVNAFSEQLSITNQLEKGITPEINPTLTTDKTDYFPTDTVYITGVNFLSNTIYTLRVFSQDNPIFNYQSEVTSTEDGNISLTLILDGNYRPNYTIEAIDQDGLVVSTTSFTDSRWVIDAKVNGSATTTVVTNSVISAEVTVVTWVGLFDSNNDWKSTSYKIGDNPIVCKNTANHNSTGLYSETISMTAPSISGVYDVVFNAYSDNHCEDDWLSFSKTLSNALNVIAPDTTAPTAEIQYSTILPTSGSVIATLVNESEPITITSVGGPTHEFLTNGIFVFEFVDAAGNTGEATATVSNIDTDTPIISIGNGNGNLNSGPLDGQAYSGNVDVYASLSDANLYNYHFRVIKDGSVDSHNCGNTLGNSENQGYGKCGYVYNQITSQTTNVDDEIISSLDTTQFGGDGTYWLILGAIDSVGNRAAPNYLNDPRVKIVVDNTAPTATIDGVAPKSLYNGSTSISVHAIDNNYLQTDLYLNNATVPFKTYTGAWFGLFWLSDGNYRMVVRDNAENSTEYTFFIDKTIPSVPVLTWPIDNITNDNTPLMQWDDSTDSGSGIAGYRYLVKYRCTDASDINSCTAVYPNSIGLWLTSSQYQAGTTADGTYYWQVRAQDNAGNQSNWSEAEKVTIDTVAPSAPTITTPGDEDYFKSSPILNQWTSVEDSSGIKEYRIEYVYDDGHHFSGEPYRTTPSTSRNHLPSISEQGGVTIKVQAIDNAGNEGAWSNSVHYFYDATAPTGSVSYSTLLPTQGPVVATLVTNDKSPVTVTNNEGLFTHSFTENGSFTFQFADAAGNTGEATATVSNIDTIAPYVEITAPTDSLFNSNIEIRGTVTDTNPHHYWLVIQNSSNVTVAGPGTVNDSTSFEDRSLFNWNTASFPDGVYTIKLEARDSANNKDASSVSWKTITLDKTAPVTTISSPSDSQFFNGAINIAGNTQDVSGVSKVDLSFANFDGEVCGEYSSIQTLTPEVDTTDYTWSYSWTPSAQGSYCIKAAGTDTVGNEEHSAIVSNITYDTVLPEVTLGETPTDGLLTNENDQTFSASVSEPVASCTLNIVGNGTGNYSERQISNGLSDGSGYSYVIGGDDWATYYGLPFNFNFYGNSYSNVSVSTNGLLRFNSPYADNSLGDSVHELQQRIAIAPLWDDIVTNVYVQNNSDNIRFRWNGYGWSTGGYLTTEAVLRSNGTVELHYGDVYLPSRAFTAGLSSGTGESVLSSVNGSTTVSPVSYSYTPGATSSYLMNNDGEGKYSVTVPDIADGIISYSVTCVDPATNEGVSDSRTMTVDTQAPALTEKTSFEGWFNEDQTSEFIFSDENGIASGTPVTCVISTEGENQVCSVTPNVCDNAGNCNTTEVTSNGANIDKTNPVVSLTFNPVTPELDNGWYQTQPEITINVVDANPELTQYQWDGTLDGDWLTYSAPIKPATEGTHTLYFRAFDKANNGSGTSSSIVKWDQTEIDFAPKNIQANPNPTSGTTSKITWEAAGDNVGINRYEIKWTLNDTTTPTSYSKSVASEVRETEIDQLTEGRWTVSVRAFDSAGHNKDAAIDLYVDRTAPVAPTLVLGATGEGTVDLSWNAIDDAKDYIIWYGTTPGGRLYGARVGLTTSYTVRGLGAGNYYFIVRSVDGAQNQSAESNEVNTGTIIGAPGVVEGTPAEGFTPEVQGLNTDATPTPESSILGITTNGDFNWWWLLLLLVIPLYIGVRKATKKH